MRADERAVMGFAYIVLARLLLVVHDPTVPTLGPQRRRAIAEIDVSVSPIHLTVWRLRSRLGITRL